MRQVWFLLMLLAIVQAVPNNNRKVQPVGRVHAPVVNQAFGCLARSAVAPESVIGDVVDEEE